MGQEGGQLFLDHRSFESQGFTGLLLTLTKKKKKKTTTKKNEKRAGCPAGLHPSRSDVLDPVL